MAVVPQPDSAWFCPHSRFVRLAFGEFGIASRAWSRSAYGKAARNSPKINPEATTPVLIEEGHPAVPGTEVDRGIFRRDARDSMPATSACCPADPFGRVEVRRLDPLVQRQIFAEVTTFLVTERIYKQTMRTEQGGGPPETVRSVRRITYRYHLASISAGSTPAQLARRRPG